MKQLIHVSCTSVQRYPEKPQFLLIRGKKYPVKKVLYTARIQSAAPPFHLVHYFKVLLDIGNKVEIEYHEKQGEWYLLDAEKYLFS